MRRFAPLLVLALLLAACSSSPPKHQSAPKQKPTPQPTYVAPPATLPVPEPGVTLSTSPAPWPAPVFFDNGALSAAYIKAAGLPYAEEMLKVHYHAHLDVIVDGQHVPVPAYLGWVAQGRTGVGLAPLHTHDATGIIHIENSVPATFLLGQFFIEWGVRLSPTCVGGYCSGNGKELAVYVNGKRYAADPNTIVLTKHEQIAIEYGKSGQLPAPPASYDFPGGL